MVVEIPSGLTGKGIVSLLHDQGLVKHPEVVYWYLRYEGALTQVEAGTHEIPPGLSAVELAPILVRPAKAREVTLTLIPGESVWEAARRIEAAVHRHGPSFLDAAEDRVIGIGRRLAGTGAGSFQLRQLRDALLQVRSDGGAGSDGTTAASSLAAVQP